MNNLKQLAIGCHLHADQHQHLPTGGWNWTWTGDPDRGFNDRQPGGWTFTVLPYIEQQNLFNIGAGLTVAQKKTEFPKRLKQPVGLFYCPTRRPPFSLPNSYQVVNSDAVSEAARTDYAGNTGTQSGSQWWIDPPAPNPAGFDTYTIPAGNPAGKADGVIFAVSTITFTQIRDGSSNTYLIGEKYLNAANYTNSAEGTDNNPTYSGMDWDWQRWSSNGLRQDRRGVSDTNSFGSAHPVTANMAFCDGSVRAISYTIDPNTHKNLCSRADGLSVDASSY